MEEVKLDIQDNGKGEFFIERNHLKIAWLEIVKKENQVWAVHTEVDPSFEGQGLAGKLFTEMVHYTRINKSNLIPRCPYILAKLKKHPDQFSDIWKAVP